MTEIVAVILILAIAAVEWRHEVKKRREEREREDMRAYLSEESKR